jgi:hypothetical protein
VEWKAIFKEEREERSRERGGEKMNKMNELDARFAGSFQWRRAKTTEGWAVSSVLAKSGSMADG